MTLFGPRKVNYRARIDRAQSLATRYPFAAEILQFYREVATFQKELYERLPQDWGREPIAPANGMLRSGLNLPILVQPFGKFLSLIKSRAPGPLASRAELMEGQGRTAWVSALETTWSCGLDEVEGQAADLQANASEPLTEFLSRAFLQPYAEFVSLAMLPPQLAITVCRCPWCNSLPGVGVLRPEGDGGKRFLQCSFCSQEWEFRRIFCASCDEDREQQLRVYIADTFPHVRVEVCETCKHFLRTIDLTKDGNAVPIVDDLAAIPLSLWAEEHGYARIQGNLLGT